MGNTFYNLIADLTFCICVFSAPTGIIVTLHCFYPTEILDGESTIVVLVSHDRAFMDAVCTDMLKVSRQKIEEHLGMGFSEYVAAAAESAAAAGHEAANLEQRKKTMAKVSACCIID